MDSLQSSETGYYVDAVDLYSISPADQERLIISAVKIDGTWVVVSRFGDDIWQITDNPNNMSKSSSQINFNLIAQAYRQAAKEIAFCFMTRGREKRKRPKGGTIYRFISSLTPFLRYLERIGSPELGKIPQLAFSNYVEECRNSTTKGNRKTKPLSKGAISKRFIAVEAMYELSQYTKTPLRSHPWPESTALSLSGMTGENAQHRQKDTTPLIPDNVFCALFEKSLEYIDRADSLLEIRDELFEINRRMKLNGNTKRTAARTEVLSRHDYNLGTVNLRHELTYLRTACYIVIASTSGCRNHELANLRIGAHHKTVEDDGETYHWMRTLSEKTFAGVCDWMIPAVAVRALRIMERWAEPYHKMLSKEIRDRRKINTTDPEIIEAQKHANSLFLSANKPKGYGGFRTLSNTAWNRQLQSFSKHLDIEWEITTHQFRKKFANYAAHSKFGDLRYLKEHFKHWTMDMTLMYAMDETWGQHFDLDLFSEIEYEEMEIKKSVVGNWIQVEDLSGGYGRSLKSWQRDPLNLAIFPDHATMIKSIAESTAIRSNGHSWCTADDTGCVGNTVERSRCGGCNNAVIGKEHAPMYQALYGNLQTLLDCKDIGEAGMIRVNRDLKRYAEVLGDLGVNVETNLGQAT